MRLPHPKRDSLSRSNKEIYDAIAATRDGHVRGPFAVWMTVPRIAAGASALGDALRIEGRLSPDLFEMTVLLCAHHWRAKYPWAVHQQLAHDAGVRASTVRAIENGVRDDLRSDNEIAVWDVVTAVLGGREITDELYSSSMEVLGPEQLVELVTTVGFYSTASMVARFFAIEPPVPA